MLPKYKFYQYQMLPNRYQKKETEIMNKMYLGMVTFALFAKSIMTPAAEIAISCGAVGKELDICKSGVAAWVMKTGHKVQVVSTPHSTTERLAYYQDLLTEQSADIDVFQIDVVWSGLLASHLVDMSSYLDEKTIKQHFPSNITANTVNGKLVAVPWFTEAGLLYYRADLLDKYQLPVPTTWAQLEEAAKTIQEAERDTGHSQMWGFVWQGHAYEGLTGNALEWINSHGGGSLLAEEGQVTVNNPQAVMALERAAKWVNTISPPEVLTFREEEARRVFQAGHAVFMRNWPYAWALTQSETSPIKGKVGIAALPKGEQGGRQTGTLGGWQLAVAKYSKNVEIAADLVAYLTGLQEQKRRALKAGYSPTLFSLYRDPEVLAANPYFAHLVTSFSNATIRPAQMAGIRYDKVSYEFWQTVHSILAGQTKSSDSLVTLAIKLTRISQNGNW